MKTKIITTSLFVLLITNAQLMTMAPATAQLTSPSVGSTSIPASTTSLSANSTSIPDSTTSLSAGSTDIAASITSPSAGSTGIAASAISRFTYTNARLALSSALNSAGKTFQLACREAPNNWKPIAGGFLGGVLVCAALTKIMAGNNSLPKIIISYDREIRRLEDLGLKINGHLSTPNLSDRDVCDIVKDESLLIAGSNLFDLQELTNLHTWLAYLNHAKKSTSINELTKITLKTKIHHDENCFFTSITSVQPSFVTEITGQEPAVATIVAKLRLGSQDDPQASQQLSQTRSTIVEEFNEYIRGLIKSLKEKKASES